MSVDHRLRKQVDEHPYPSLFATISGAHLYGFPSPDSDYDLRGVHLLPLKEVVGLETGPETVEKSGIHDGFRVLVCALRFDARVSDPVRHRTLESFQLIGIDNERLVGPLRIFCKNAAWHL